GVSGARAPERHRRGGAARRHVRRGRDLTRDADRAAARRRSRVARGDPLGAPLAQRAGAPVSVPRAGLPLGGRVGGAGERKLAIGGGGGGGGVGPAMTQGARARPPVLCCHRGGGPPELLVARGAESVSQRARVAT